MTLYAVLRHGSNGANQPMTQTMAVGTIEASGREAAKAAAAERWTCYANQYFDPIPWSGASRTLRDAALEADQYQGMSGWLP